MKKLEIFKTVVYAIVRDNHGDLQKVPAVDGKIFLLPDYQLLEVWTNDTNINQFLGGDDGD